MRRACLAVDLGSTTFKARLYDEALDTIRETATPLVYRRGGDGAVELAPDAAERALEGSVAGALEGEDPRSLRAVALTSQAQTLSLRDLGGGPTPFVSWMDGRAATTAAALARDPALADFADHASFGAPVAGLALCILARLSARRATPLGRVSFLSAWAVEKLTGAPALDDNLAAMTGLYSLRSRGWWPAALERAGVVPADLPPVLPVGAVAGATASGWPGGLLPAGVPVVLAGNDQTAGAYGCGVHASGATLVTLGTAQVAYRAAPREPPPDQRRFRGPYPGGRWYTAAVDDGGGSLVSWACSVIAGCGDPDAFFALAGRSPAGARGLRFSPERWEGLTQAHGPEELARSILEHLVRTVAEVVGRLGPLPAGAPILVAGGGSRQGLWMELLSAALGAPLRATNADPLRGAALLGLEAAGAARGRG